MPFVTEMRRLIDEGAIGEPRAAWCRHFVGQGGELYFTDWHADRRKTNGLLLQKGAHDIDVIQWLCGARASVVTALGGLLHYGDRRARERAVVGAGAAVGAGDLPYPDGEWTAGPAPEPVVDVEDTSMALMLLDNGVLASYHQCHFTPDHWRNYTIIGTQGRIENVGDMGSGAEVRVWNRRRPGHDELADRRVPVSGGRWDADLRLVDQFLRHVSEGSGPVISPVAARDAVATACAATDSLRRGGRPVAVPAFDAGGAP
jgi:predicted dehydrogenase